MRNDEQGKEDTHPRIEEKLGKESTYVGEHAARDDHLLLEKQ